MNEGMVWCLMNFDESDNKQMWPVDRKSNKCQKTADLQKKAHSCRVDPRINKDQPCDCCKTIKTTIICRLSYQPDSPEKERN